MYFGYLVSSYFIDIYLYLAQNKLPSTKSAIRKTEALAEKYILLDPLLFKILSSPEKKTAVLAIPEVCTDIIITLYHSRLFARHQRVIKTYLTIKQYILYTQFVTLFVLLYKKLSHMSTYA